MGARTQAFDGGRVRLQPRPWLLDRLIEETGGSSSLRRLTVVCAPTGYSKSRTVATWLGDPSDVTSDVSWVLCTDAPGDSLWSSLIHTLGTHAEHAALPPHTDLSHEALGLAEQLTSPITIIIDDYHHETSAENDLALAELSAVSPLLTVVIITRRVTLLNSTLVSARTRVRLIGADDLALTIEEAHQLAASLGISPTERLYTTLERAGGWPLAVLATLNLGSDSLYMRGPDAQTWNTASGTPTFDPVANLDSFALDHLELLDRPAREVILAASQLDAISLIQVQQLLDLGPEQALAVVQELLGLGIITELSAPNGVEYRCHSSVKSPLSALAVRSTTFAQRAAIYRRRAAEIEHSAPLTAFKLYCAAEDFGPAEVLLARNFTILTDETEDMMNVLRGMPEETLVEYPTLIAAQLFLKIPQHLVAPATIEYLVGLWAQGLQLRLPEGASTKAGPIHLPLLCQTMVAARIGGQLDVAGALLRNLEGRLIPGYLADEHTEASGHTPLRSLTRFTGSLPIYFREAAATALAVEDLEGAKRHLQQLKRHSERQIAKPWHGFPYASTRTVTDAESGNRWLLTALGELAFTEMIDGNMRDSAEILAEMDTHATRSGAAAPGISWVGAEIARAYLAYESDDDALYQVAAARLAPLSGQLEAWQLLLIADAAMLRNTRGPEVALSHFRAAIAQTGRAPATQHEWGSLLLTFEAMLSTSTGNFQRSGQLLDSILPNSSSSIQLERARLALFAGEHVEALLLSKDVSDVNTTKRQQIDRYLISAVAAWSVEQRDAAFRALSKASQMIERYWLPSKLLGVPFDSLREVALAARDANVCDLVARIDEIPVHARTRSYGRLTEMELRTLNAIARHRTANHAAAELYVTTGTIKKHLAAVYRKLGASGRDEAIFVASHMGIIEQQGAQ